MDGWIINMPANLLIKEEKAYNIKKESKIRPKQKNKSLFEGAVIDVTACP